MAPKEKKEVSALKETAVSVRKEEAGAGIESSRSKAGVTRAGDKVERVGQSYPGEPRVRENEHPQ